MFIITTIALSVIPLRKDIVIHNPNGPLLDNFEISIIPVMAIACNIEYDISIDFHPNLSYNFPKKNDDASALNPYTKYIAAVYTPALEEPIAVAFTINNLLNICIDIFTSNACNIINGISKYPLFVPTIVNTRLIESNKLV